MRLLIPLLICFLLSFNIAIARPLVADLSLRQIDITSSFKGTEILLFGARNEAGDIVVVVRGPDQSYVMRKKRKFGPIWANKDKAIIKNVQSYNSSASSRALKELRNDRLIQALSIGVNNINIDVETKKVKNIARFREAFLQDREQRGLYFPEVGEVQFIGNTLFRTIIKFPDNIPRGTYTAEVYLFSDGQLSGFQSTPLQVKKKGFDAFIYNAAYEHSLLYGISAVLMAIFAGWIAGTLFRKV